MLLGLSYLARATYVVTTCSARGTSYGCANARYPLSLDAVPALPAPLLVVGVAVACAVIAARRRSAGAAHVAAVGTALLTAGIVVAGETLLAVPLALLVLAALLRSGATPRAAAADLGVAFAVVLAAFGVAYAALLIAGVHWLGARVGTVAQLAWLLLGYGIAVAIAIGGAIARGERPFALARGAAIAQCALLLVAAVPVVFVAPRVWGGKELGILSLLAAGLAGGPIGALTLRVGARLSWAQAAAWSVLAIVGFPLAVIATFVFAALSGTPISGIGPPLPPLPYLPGTATH